MKKKERTYTWEEVNEALMQTVNSHATCLRVLCRLVKNARRS